MTAAPKLWNDGRELVLFVPVKVLAESNWRGHHVARYRRTKGQKDAVGLVVQAALARVGQPGFPCTVTLVRLIGSGGRMLDDDNNVGGMKAIRDAVAACLNVDDGWPHVTWRCAQRKDKPARWGVEVRIAKGVG